MQILYALIILLSVGGCSESPSPIVNRWQEIVGRDETRTPLYRAKVPTHWQRINLATESLADTTKSICEYTIDDTIRIAIHNFPSDHIEDRIPPTAQVARWKRQAHANDAIVTPQAHGGFLGLKLECDDMMAWSMQMAPEHYQTLSDNRPFSRHIRADYTIKATGPHEALIAHRDEIDSFARSFELIEEIPLAR